MIYLLIVYQERMFESMVLMKKSGFAVAKAEVKF